MAGETPMAGSRRLARKPVDLAAQNASYIDVAERKRTTFEETNDTHKMTLLALLNCLPLRGFILREADRANVKRARCKGPKRQQDQEQDLSSPSTGFLHR